LFSVLDFYAWYDKVCITWIYAPKEYKFNNEGLKIFALL